MSALPEAFPPDTSSIAMYFNDDYRIKPNLTLNLGIRYEYMTVPVVSRYQSFSSAARSSRADHLRRAQAAKEQLGAARRHRLVPWEERLFGRFVQDSASTMTSPTTT